MKLLKMQDKADNQFDRFVKAQLDKTDVDMTLADKYFAQMQLPIDKQTTLQNQGRRRFFIWFALCSLVAIVTYFFTMSEKKSPRIQANQQSQVANNPIASQPARPAIATDQSTFSQPAGATGDAFTNGHQTTAGVAATNNATAQVRQPNDTGQINLILTDNHAAAVEKPLSVDEVILVKSSQVEQPPISKDTTQITAFKVDSAVKRQMKAAVLAKPKDSVYIIW